MCGPHRRFAPLLSRTLRRILQVVGVIATMISAEFTGFVRTWAFQYRKR